MAVGEFCLSWAPRKMGGGGGAARPMQIRAIPRMMDGACDIAVVEWGGFNFAPLSLAGVYGCETLRAKARWADRNLGYGSPCCHRGVNVVLGIAETAAE